MNQIICYGPGRYNIYSTVTNGFFFNKSISLKQLVMFIKEEQGAKGLSILPERLKRAHEQGHSSPQEDNLDELLFCNRAGKNETKLTTAECIKQYLS